MDFPRVFWPLVFSAGLAACSGNLGGGQTTLPGTPPVGGTNVQQIGPVATPTPSSASNVATLSDNVAPQALPAVMGWGGSITFPKPVPAPAASPNPRATATPAATATNSSVSVGITAGVVEPSEAPRFSPASSKHHSKHDPNALTALFFISLLATSDVTLGEYPKLAVDVPRDIASKHRDDTYALALYDPEDKAKAYKLAIAERDLSSPLPGSLPTPVATPVPTPPPVPTPFGMPNGPAAFTPPPLASDPLSGLPPERVAFQATAATLTLKANRPVVFALYAIPPQPSPSPSGSPVAAATAGSNPAPSNSSSPAAPASQSSAPANPAPAPKPSP